MGLKNLNHCMFIFYLPMNEVAQSVRSLGCDAAESSVSGKKMDKVGRETAPEILASSYSSQSAYTD